MQVDSNGDVYVAAVRTNKVIKFNPELEPIAEFTDKLEGPWGVIFDGAENMIVANFGRNDEPDMFGFTKIKDNNSYLYTLPTGGKPVKLANRFLLNGNDGPPSFEPLMRLTATNIDAVGNIWTINNWKPSALVDLQGNPGGDGVVVFLGQAVPKF